MTSLINLFVRMTIQIACCTVVTSVQVLRMWSSIYKKYVKFRTTRLRWWRTNSGKLLTLNTYTKSLPDLIEVIVSKTQRLKNFCLTITLLEVKQIFFATSNSQLKKLRWSHFLILLRIIPSWYRTQPKAITGTTLIARCTHLSYITETTLVNVSSIEVISCQSGDSVACLYDGLWWIGSNRSTSDEHDDVQVLFMHPHGPSKSFKWPQREDVCWVSRYHILCKILCR